jgi:alpha-tubulin suppressor-like RCC1 family protein
VNLPGVQKIAAGFEHTCAIQSGAAFCWGLNDRGQLGANPGAAASSAAPVAVSGR